MSVPEIPINSTGSRTEDLQKLIEETGRNGWIFIPEGEYEIEDRLEIHQPNITILGDRNNLPEIGGNSEDKIVITRENVTIRNLSIRGTGENHEDGVVLKGIAQHCVLDNLKFDGIGRYGIYRPQNHASGISSIFDCMFDEIGEAGIRAESGSGPLNMVGHNQAEDEDLTLIEWGVNNSLLRANQGKTVLTSASANNQVFDRNPEENIDDQPETNEVHELEIE